MRLKLTDYEKEVWRRWDALTLIGHDRADRARSIEEFRQSVLDQQEAWDGLLELAHDGTRWKVGAPTATTIAGSRWFNAMYVKDYPRAEREIQMWFEHPNAAAEDPIEEVADARIRLLVAQLAQCGDGAAGRIQKLVEAGPRSPGIMAAYVYPSLTLLLEGSPESPPTSELLSLAAAIATARRATKRQIRTSSVATNFGELAKSLEAAMGFKRVDPSQPGDERAL